MKRYFILRSIIVCFFLSFVFQSFSQEDYSQYLTSFTETDAPTGEVRFPAEFEPAQAVVVAHYQEGRNLPTRLIKEMAEDCKVITLVNSAKWFTTQEVKTLYSSAGVNIDNCEFIEVPLSGRWTRDYAPWFIFDNGKPAIVDNIYDRVFPGTGNNNSSQIYDDAISAKFAEYYDVPLYGMKVVHTGGNMMQDGRGIAVSDSIVITESKNYINVSAEDVHQKMKDYLGIDTYHVTVDPQGDYIAHVDCWGKFLAPDKIILARVEATHAQYEKYESVAKYFENTNCCWGYPYKVYRVDVPTRNDNRNIASPYTNSLILNKKVFVPLDADTDDYYNNAALAVYEQAMPGYEIIGIEYNYDNEAGDWDGWYNTDALHCRTREIMDFNMLFVDHREVLHGDVAQKSSYPITAKFIAYSGDAITSTQLHYSINDGEWQTIGMSVQGTSNEYKANIPSCNVGDKVKYYLTGTDASNRTCAQPYFAELEPHEFTVVAGAGSDDNDDDDDNDNDIDITNLNTFTGKGNWNSATSWSQWNVPADDEDVAIKGNVTIPNGTTVVAGKIFIVDGGSITIEDGGQLIHNQEDLIATVNKSISGYGTDNSWHTISSPLKGKADIANISGLVTATGNYDLYYYDEPTHYWINHKATDDFTTLDAGRGYLYANSENTTLKFTGTLNNDDVQYQLTTDATDVLTGFHLIGNPFTHNIYMENNTVSSNDEILSSGYYALSGDGNWSATPLNNATAIAPCQGVLIQALQESTLTIVKSHKAPATRSAQPALNITVANEQYDDNAYVLFKEGQGLNKINHMNENIPMIYVVSDNEKFAIANVNDNEEIALGFEAMTMGEYTIAVKAQDCKFNSMTLTDKKTGVKTNLLTDSYTFMATTTDNPNRFTLTLNNDNDADNDADNDFIYIDNNEMIINNIEGDGLVQIYDVMGRSVATYNVSDSVNISMETLSNGVYVVRMTDDNGVKTQKVVWN